MSGHSKWSTIKHKKAAADAKKGQIFSQMGKKIATAARHGGPDPEVNAELRLYIQKAKAANMPAANIERAILKATGQLPDQVVESFTYEGYGPGGVAFYMEGTTDNKNRTVSHVRHTLSKHGGNLGANGCVAWMFHAQGVISLSCQQLDSLDSLLELAMEHGALDFTLDEELVSLICPPQDFFTLREALMQAGHHELEDDELTMIASDLVTPAANLLNANLKILEALDEDEDIERVYHNMLLE